MTARNLLSLLPVHSIDLLEGFLIIDSAADHSAIRL